MPKVPTDYSKTIIYKIVCNDLNVNECYIGHTTNFIKRKGQHKSNCNNINGKSYNLNVYNYIRENGGWDNFSMIEIEKYPCNDKREAEAQERYFLEQLGATLNSQKRPITSDKEKKNKKYEKDKRYRTKYEEKIKEKKKQYYEENKHKINEKRKEIYKNKKEYLKEKVECEICNKTLSRFSLYLHNKRFH